MIAPFRPDVVDPARRGMTLVELLVVTGLVGALLALTVVGVRGGSRPKRTAEDLASLLASAQGRALGVPEGAAVILDPSGTGGGIYCTNGFDAEMLPLIAATTSGSLPLGDTSATITVSPSNGDDVSRAYRILLCRGSQPGSADEPYQPPTSWFQFTSPGTISFRLGQTPSNTIWPRPPASGSFDALLAQYPVKSSVAAEFDPTTAVDLRFSGVGDDRNAAYGRLDDPVDQGAIAVVFDRVGRVAEIMRKVPEPGATTSDTTPPPQPHVPTSPIYFLVAPLSEVKAGKNTLATRESLWVALAPQSGRVFVAENVPVSGDDNEALWNSRANARRGITGGK